MKRIVQAACAAAALVLGGQAMAQVTFFEHDRFRGRSFNADRALGNFQRFGFNDQASSVVVERGQWEVCEDAGFQGRCVVLRRGEYPELRSLGLNDRVSSVRPVDGPDVGRGPVPVPAPGRGFDRSGAIEMHPAPEVQGEAPIQLYQVPVTSVRAVGSNNEGQPAYYEVTYLWHGEQRWVRMQKAPGTTLNVTASGHPYF